MAGPALTRRWFLAAAIVVAVAGTAWVAAGVYTRRTLAAGVPALPDLQTLPAAVQAAVRDADARARSAPDAATLGALGQAYHAAQLPAPALAAYGIAESLAPDDWTWTYHRALVLEERNDAATDAALERATTLSPGHGLAWYRLAELRFKQGRLDDAVRAYSRAHAAPAALPFMPPGVGARQTVPLSAYADLGRVRVALERDSKGALVLLRAIVGSYPAFGPARAMLRQIEPRAPTVDALFARSGFDAPYVPPADPVVDALVASSVHSDLLLKHAGLAARAGDDAWRDFLARRALRFNPDDLNVLMEMAAMLQATNRPAEALTFLTRHEALAPGDHHGLVQQGRVLADLDRLTEAEAVLRRATAVRDAAAEYNLGTVLDRQDRWDEARAHYERALAINPFHTRAMNNLGAGLDQRGQTPAAIAWFERAIAIAPDAGEFYVNYGSALIRARRIDDAVQALTTAVTLTPRDANAHNNLGIALASQGQLPRARDAFARALEINPRHPNARDNFDRVTAALAR